MTSLRLTLLFLLLVFLGKAQVEIPESKYAVYQYNETLKTEVLTYQYANLWDLDNDGKKDSVAFIGNGGAHVYFHLKFKLSAQNKWHEYPTFLIDMPFLSAHKIFDTVRQFSVFDFDKDGVVEIYLNIDNGFASIPDELSKKGLNSKKFFIDVEGGEISFKEFKQ